MESLPVTIVVFIECVVVLTWFSHVDISTRRIPNRQILVALVLASLTVIASGYLFDHLILHASAVGFTGFMVCVLYRLGSIGGGDVKLLLIVAFLSPGVIFVSGMNPVFEGIIASGLLIFGMLLLGWLYSRMCEKKDASCPRTIIPLVPCLTLSYIILQTIAVVLRS